jgi:hypothetical protein
VGSTLYDLEKERRRGVMARYIDVDVLKESIKYYYSHTGEQSTNAEHYAYGVALKEIDQTPTADVVEVVRGEWFLLDDCANEGVYCSACHKKVYKTEYANQKLKSNYCPNCGAKMDGGKDE